MKLYHATQAENTDSINEYGLSPLSTDDPTRPVGSEYQTLQGRGLIGVYGWATLEDAKFFAREECGGDGVVFEFDANDVVDDPEFDGAKFAVTDDPIPAVLIWQQWG